MVNNFDLVLNILSVRFGSKTPCSIPDKNGNFPGEKLLLKTKNSETETRPEEGDIGCFSSFVQSIGTLKSERVRVT